MSLSAKLFPAEVSSLAALEDEDGQSRRLRLRRKLAEYESVKELPEQLAAKLKAAGPTKKRIVDRTVREKISLGPDADASSTRLIDGLTAERGKEGERSLVVRSNGNQTAGANPGASSSAVSTIMARSSLANTGALEKPQWHAPWKLKRVITGHQGWVRSVCMDPDNKFFCTGSADRTIKVWDTASGTLLVSLTGHIMAVRGLVVSPRHPYLFSGGEDKMVKCWDLEHNKVVRHYHGHLSGVYSVDLHPTLDLLVTAGRDSVARVWDIRTRHPVHVLSGHKGAISQVRCQEADPQIITTSMDSTVRLWDLVAGKTQTVLTHHKKSVRALAMHPTEFTFATGSPDNIKQWKCPEGAFMSNFTPNQNSIINTLSVNEDGVMFAGGDNGSMGFFDWKSAHKFQETRTIAAPGSLSAETGIFASTFDRSGLRLITCEADKSIKMWEEDRSANPETHPGIEWKPQLAQRY